MCVFSSGIIWPSCRPAARSKATSAKRLLYFMVSGGVRHRYSIVNERDKGALLCLLRRDSYSVIGLCVRVSRERIKRTSRQQVKMAGGRGMVTELTNPMPKIDMVRELAGFSSLAVCVTGQTALRTASACSFDPLTALPFMESLSPTATLISALNTEKQARRFSAIHSYMPKQMCTSTHTHEPMCMPHPWRKRERDAMTHVQHTTRPCPTSIYTSALCLVTRSFYRLECWQTIAQSPVEGGEGETRKHAQ